MEKVVIDVKKSAYASAKEARRDGQIPLNYYGRGITPAQFTVEYQNFRKAYKKTGKSAIMTLNEEGKEHDVLVHEIQYDPVTDNMIHIDLVAVDKNRVIHTEIPLVFTGVPPAVRELGGTLVTGKSSLKIECLPKDLPHEIEVDVSGIADFHTSLTVADIKIPQGVKVLDSMDINIANVAAPRAEEEEVKVAAPAEGEATAGAAPAAGAAGAAGTPEKAAATKPEKGKPEKKAEKK